KLDPRGILLASGAAIFCTVQFFSGRAISSYMTPAAFGALVHVAIWPATLLVAVVAGGGTLQFLPGGAASGTGLLYMAGVGAVYVAAYLVHMLSLRYAPASTVAPFYNLEPIVAAAVAAVLLGERLSLNQYAGGGMVLAALVASSFLTTAKNS